MNSRILIRIFNFSKGKIKIILKGVERINDSLRMEDSILGERIILLYVIKEIGKL